MNKQTEMNDRDYDAGFKDGSSQLAGSDMVMELERLRTIERHVCHLMDSAMDDGSGYLKIDMEISKYDLEKLDEMLPAEYLEPDKQTGSPKNLFEHNSRDKVRIADLEVQIFALRVRVEELEEELVGWVKSHDAINEQLIKMTDFY